MNQHFSIKGRFKIQKFRKGVINYESHEIGNLITNIGLDRISNSSGFNSCIVGSGSSAPTFGDQWLDTFVARTTSQVGSPNWSGHEDGEERFVRVVSTWRFSEGQAAGNLSEIGMAWGSNSGTLFCRALIVDSFGNPTTITVLPDEYLQVTYIHEYYLDLSDKTGQITLDGELYDYTVRLAGIFSDWSFTNGSTGNTTFSFESWQGANNATTYASDGPLQDPTQAITGSKFGVGSGSNLPYVPGSYQMSRQMIWGLSNGNVSGGIRKVVFSFVRIQASGVEITAMAQCGFVPPVPKTNLKILTLTFTVSWGRHE